MNKKAFRNAVVDRLNPRAESVVQQRPHTYVGLIAKIGKTKIQAHGFSKVSYPDVWSEQVGFDVAYAKARRALANEIFANGLSKHSSVQRAIREVTADAS